jgi:hypothetical protein
MARKMISDDDRFNNALPAFTKLVRNLFSDRDEDLRRRIAQVITSKLRVGEIGDPIFPRYALYREHALGIGDDFLSAFDRIIKPYCGVISNSSKMNLVKILAGQYRYATAQEASHLRELAASVGRSDDLEGMIRPAESIYGSANTKYKSRLDAQIEKHNLEVGVKKGESEQKLTETQEGERTTPERKRKKANPEHGAYVEALKRLSIARPTLKELESGTGILSSTWHRRFTDAVWLTGLCKELKKRQSAKYSKTEVSKTLMIDAESYILEKLDRFRSNRVSLKSTRLKREVPDSPSGLDPYRDLEEVMEQEKTPKGKKRPIPDQSQND